MIDFLNFRPEPLGHAELAVVINNALPGINVTENQSNSMLAALLCHVGKFEQYKSLPEWWGSVEQDFDLVASGFYRMKLRTDTAREAFLVSFRSGAKPFFDAAVVARAIKALDAKQKIP